MVFDVPLAPPQLQLQLDHPTLRIGLVAARAVANGPSDTGLLAAMSEAESAARSGDGAFSETTRAAIRDMLRHGGYKPTGRGKPASEFLWGVAREAGLPRICTLVDVNNLASLRHAHPISIFDAELLGDGPSIRFGRPGESYVFNAAGQSIDLAGLPVVCRGPSSEPVGNAVKDAMICKVHGATRQVLAVVYGSHKLPERALADTCQELAQLLRAHAGAAEVATVV